MRCDKVICAQRFPVEQSPDGLIINLLASRHFGRYLRNPDMEGAVYSTLAAVMPERFISTQKGVTQVSLTPHRLGWRACVHDATSCYKVHEHIPQRLPLPL